jgi:AraC-like DNA-binding protein
MPADTLEILARGAAAGFACILTLAFLKEAGRSEAARFGAMFGGSIIAYILVCSPQFAGAFGPVAPLLRILSIPVSVFFWWFAEALFNDRFTWHWLRLVPLVIIAASGTAFFFAPADWPARIAALAVLHATVLVITLMAIFMALRDWRDDLVAPRRRFRLAFALTVGLASIALAGLDLAYAQTGLPGPARGFQTALLFVLSFTFAGWAVLWPEGLFPPQARRHDLDARLATGQVEDPGLARRLAGAMEDRIYREAGLTVGGLASRLHAPEHRLRRLINRELGYRNFSSFLNTHRIADACERLADPGRAREQILTIALDLGYGSIAPFNRAFRGETGTTPTAWRREALRGA